MHGHLAGYLTEKTPFKHYRFEYLPDYNGEPVSRTMPFRAAPYEYDTFPPFFDGLLPEGPQLEGLLRIHKIDRSDLFSQLVAIGGDTVGAVTVELDTAKAPSSESGDTNQLDSGEILR